jgi:hypothetical protein
MADAFVPLVPPKGNKSRDAAAPQSNGNGSSGGFVQVTPATAKSADSHTDTCAKPVVTLKREGNTVTGIRIECGCGSVLELACTY